MSSGFISEAEIAVAKQKRQEEWEKVRRPDEPIEYPEEPHDSRSLYERLKEQKDQKDLEFEESHKLKNLIRGLVEDEVEFLDVIDKATLNAKRKREQEENSEIQDYRKKVAELKEQTIDSKLSAGLTTVKPQTKSTNLQKSNRLNQKSILAGVIRKRKIDNTTPITLATTTTTTTISSSSSSSLSNSDDGDRIEANDCSNEKIIKNDINQKGLQKTINSLANNNINNHNNNNNNNNITANNNNQGYNNIKSNNSKHLYCIGILPSYVEIASDSSDSEQSTDIEDYVIDNSRDWLGRKKISVDANAVIEQHSNK